MKILHLLILILCFHTASTQVLIQFIPELQGRTVDGLLTAKISSQLPEKRTVILMVAVSEKSVGKIVSINSGAFDMYPGNNSLPRAAFSAGRIQFANNGTATLLKQSAFLPEGEYEYCYQVVLSEKGMPGDVLGEQCFNYLVEPLTPLFLIEPYYKEKICDKRPTFTWQPSVPMIPGAMYRLTLSEVKPDQLLSEALNYNIPLINQANISSPILIYPASAKALEEGKKYTWQVTVYKDNQILNRSEVWEFTVQCNEPPKPDVNDGYRDIEDLVKGNFYMAEGRIRFSFDNPYEAGKLHYSIACLNKPDLKMKRLPEVKLKRGTNNISIDLSENKSFIDGYHYIITIQLPNRSTQKLRFLYKSPL